MPRYYPDNDHATSSANESIIYPAPIVPVKDRREAVNFMWDCYMKPLFKGENFFLGFAKFDTGTFLTKVTWVLLLCIYLQSAFAQSTPHKQGYTYSSSRDSLLWSLDIIDNVEYLNYTRTIAPYWEGSYALTPNYQWSHMTWDTITRQWESTLITYQYAAIHTTTGKYAVVFLTYVSYHDRIKNTRYTFLEGVRFFHLE